MTSPTTDRRYGINGGVAIKAPCDCATTANITLSGEQTIDGVTTSGSRVLVKNQTTASQNGIYRTNTGSWTREPDFDGNRDVVTGTIVMVVGGSTNINTYWRLSTTGTITIGTSSLTFAAALAGDSSLVGFVQAGTGAVTRTVQAKERDRLDVFDFIPPSMHAAIMAGTSNEDVKAYWDLAIAQAVAEQNKTVHIGSGRGYRIDGLITIPQGVMIVGDGSQGSTANYGCSITHYSNGGLFLWDGSGTANKGTGGGLKNVLLLKADGYSGGDAIKLLATDDDHRPGEMVFENVLGYGLGTGLWSRGLHIDGTACNTAGARGVRSIHCKKVRFADVSTANETILLNQVSHFYAHGLACDTADGSAAGIYLKGINDGVYLDALGCAGTFQVIADDASNTTNNLVVSGKIGGSITVNDTQVNGALMVANDGGGIAIKSKDLKLIADNAPEFLAIRATSAANVTGDGTNYQVAFDNEVFDTLSNFGTNTFTCTVAGKYHFSAGVFYTGLGAGHTRSDITITKTGTPVRSIADVSNPYAQSTSGQATRSLSCTLNLSYGDTVYVRATVTGSTKTVNVYGTSGTDYTWFSGKYLP